VIVEKAFDDGEECMNVRLKKRRPFSVVLCNDLVK